MGDLMDLSKLLKENRQLLISFLLFLLLLSGFQVSAGDYDLNGVWNCDDNGKYYIVQTGEDVYWFGEQKELNPEWANLAIGKINGNIISLKWFDLPKGKMKQNGELTLEYSEIKISDTHQALTAVGKTGNFGGSKWTRTLLG